MSTRARLSSYLFASIALVAPLAAPPPAAAQGSSYKGPDFDLTAASVTYLADLDLLVFEQRVAGTAGGTVPAARGQLDDAPVLGYVFPTSLPSTAVGFGKTDGIVALAITSHPDFDDTPLWDENGDGNFGNDGVRWHTHWVLLGKDAGVPGGLSVKEFTKADVVVLPPTAPPMPMYMDAPGFAVSTKGQTLKVLVPVSRLRLDGAPAFSFDAVTCYMQVSAPQAGADGHDAHAKADKPMLGVYDVFDVLSGNLSLPYRVATR
jgi:hypothetical protein